MSADALWGQLGYELSTNQAYGNGDKYVDKGGERPTIIFYPESANYLIINQRENEASGTVHVYGMIHEAISTQIQSYKEEGAWGVWKR